MQKGKPALAGAMQSGTIKRLSRQRHYDDACNCRNCRRQRAKRGGRKSSEHRH